MSNLNPKIEDHYYRPNLYEDILARLKEMNVGRDRLSRADISGVDEFHVRGAEVSKELAAAVNLRNNKVLDVGCGIGGPCRMLADEFECAVTGIDLSHEFIITAQKLSALLGLTKKTSFLQADALNLPFADASFEVVWTQHVQMNIADKTKFYSEISRVLNDGGTFLYYDIFKQGNKEVSYPMPWAGTAGISFLEQATNIENILSGLGLIKEEITDQTEKGIVFFENLLKKSSLAGPPKIGLNLLMGATTKDKLTNLLHALKERKIILQSGIYIK